MVTLQEVPLPPEDEMSINVHQVCHVDAYASGRAIFI